MALRINYNYQADFTHVNLLKTERNLNTALERLSTGYRINSAKDDAAGLFIADQLKLVANALDQGSRNAQDGISAAQIAESSLSQIYDKLVTMYTKAQQAAADTNDANARQALQKDIQKLVDAIDKIASTSEFNGLKLLDGTFQNKVIHFGPRADQTLSISIDSARAKDLGAYVVNGTGQSVAYQDTLANTLTNNPDYEFKTTETINIGGVTLTPTNNEITDAKRIADFVNNNETLKELGFQATAKNKSVADNTWQNIAVGSDDSVTFNFYVGPEESPDFSITYTGGSTITLDDLIQKINSEAAAKGLDLTAKAENNKLVLETNGETVAIEASVTAGGTAGNTSFNLGQFIQGGSSITVDDSNTKGTAIKVGDLTVLAPESYAYDFTGVSSALGLTSATGTALLNNLNSLDVTNNANAELAMKVIDTTIKKVDSMRSSLGSIQINLQAIVDNNNFAATQTREAESRIRNVDFAKEMAEFTRQQTLMQSGMAMLAQANQLPQLVLQLLR
ncbi:flagellin [Balnearium lithotrophicum]|uniref:Flagellin n=1 Tax=Balnearium lithotrophicum TaxID=223788 RepID=A0A521DBM5_9BACT|nr:flagellin [Balnearium lithotrophicum]SMO69093.1 flagellin [Balnearium lithotrophicum]